MSLTIAATLALAAQCAPSIAPETLLSIVHVESRFDPLVIGVNGQPPRRVVAASVADAAAKARTLIAEGRSVDLGLAQINSGNLGWLGLTVEDAFEPCANLAAAARILREGYARSGADRVGTQAALKTTLSYYNTGRARSGIANGYVAKVTRAAGYVVPAIRSIGDPAAAANADFQAPAPIETPEPPAWDVFARSPAQHGFILRISAPWTGDFQ